VKRNWQDKRVVVIGAARQGLALARYLSRHGAKVLMNDKRTEGEMEEARAALADASVEWVLGGHPLHLLNEADLLCVSGGVPLTNPLIVAAVERGVPVSNDTQVFMEAVPCRTVGITGSAGKTTTTTLVGRIAEKGASGKYRRIWTGGNIGDPLLNYLDEMQPDDLAILEISSFQLDQMTRSPNVAAILNITPNHLDRHGTMEAYTAAKARILDFQSVEDAAVLGRDDPGAWNLRDRVHGRLLSFGFGALPAGSDGAYVYQGRYFIRSESREIRVPVEELVELRGEHNRLNVLAACAIAFAAGFTPDEMTQGIAGFRGVAHRLEFVREHQGVSWYNDSIATAPERTIAAIRSFDTPLVLMLGGRDKNLPWDELAALIHERVDHVVLFGEASEKIAAALGSQASGASGKRPYTLTRCKGLEDAVQAASRAARPGYVVLFSPGGTSFDQFKDFEERGKSFRQWVLGLS
jgi:UDP-N-acetylmuramoylalanine--D-glutamate ligase